MTLILIDASLSPYANKGTPLKILLAEKRLPYVRHTVGTAPAAVRALLASVSPRGEVPVLVDTRPPGPGGQGALVLHDSTVIAEYLDDAYPDVPMRPEGAVRRARARTVEDAMDTHFEACTWALNEVLAFGRAGPEGSPLRAAVIGKAKEELRAWQAWLEAQVEGPFVCGERFSVADAAAASVMAGAVGYGVVPAPGSRLGKWWAAVRERDSVRGVLKANKEEAQTMKAAVGNFSKGVFRRQYRDHRLEFMIRAGGLEIVAKGLEDKNIRFSEPAEFVRVAGNLASDKVKGELAKL
ncbi:hypothetical protein DFJ74DRAFT_774851 [Hyaloraphidium curvatum]|nr:hypothetical protein DFJ74DRAFT_774851 [Hyaloraphidium curvatum]